MLTLQNRNETPPGGFRFRIDGLPNEFQWVGPTHSFNDLRNDIRKRCSANGLPVPSDAQIEHQICQTMPNGKCNDENGLPYNGIPMTGLNIETFKQGTATLVDWWWHGRKKVSADETIRRSQICSSCQYNVPIGHCAACAMKSVHDLVNQVVAGEQLPTDNLLNACSLCSCSLRAKVRIPLDVLKRHISESILTATPGHCWLRE